LDIFEAEIKMDFERPCVPPILVSLKHLKSSISTTGPARPGPGIPGRTRLQDLGAVRPALCGRAATAGRAARNVLLWGSKGPVRVRLRLHLSGVTQRRLAATDANFVVLRHFSVFPDAIYSKSVASCVAMRFLTAL